MLAGAVVDALMLVIAVPATVFALDHALLFVYPVCVNPLIVGNVHAFSYHTLNVELLVPFDAVHVHVPDVPPAVIEPLYPFLFNVTFAQHAELDVEFAALLPHPVGHALHVGLALLFDVM